MIAFAAGRLQPPVDERGRLPSAGRPTGDTLTLSPEDGGEGTGGGGGRNLSLHTLSLHTRTLAFAHRCLQPPVTLAPVRRGEGRGEGLAALVLAALAALAALSGCQGLARRLPAADGPLAATATTATKAPTATRADAPASAADAPAPTIDDDVGADDATAAGFLGVVLAGQTVELGPRADARVEQVFVKPGDPVRRGTRIAQMDVRALRADLALARATLANARRRLARRVPLANGVISPEELGDARAQVIERQTRVRQIREAIADASIPAPFDGQVAQRYVDPGGMAGPNRPVVRLLSGDDVRVRFAIPEQRLGEVAVGSGVRVQVRGLDVPLAGVVESVAPEVDAAARMIFAAARLEVPVRLAARVSSGMIARVAPAAPVAALGGSPP